MEIITHHNSETPVKKGRESDHQNDSGNKKERRRASFDRRRSVNEGIFVHISSRKDRRAYYERRRYNTILPFFPGDSSQLSPETIFLNIVA